MPGIIWKGYISFGLVSFPVRLSAAARPERVRFHMLHEKDHSRVKEVWYCAQEDKPIARSEIVKGYETSKDEYVVVEDEELKKIAPPTATTMDIIQFVSSDEVDPLYFESSYYVSPEESTARPYQLFLSALVETQQHAIAQIAMHQREHVVLIRPVDNGLVLHTLYYPDELHTANKHTVPNVKNPVKELALAKSLVGHLTAPFKPEKFFDSYRRNVEKLIAQKSKGQRITAVPQTKRAPVIDLMEALKHSLTNTAASSKRTSGTEQKASRKRRAA